MTILEYMIAAACLMGVFLIARLLRAYIECVVCIQNLKIAYYLLGVRICRVNENEDYFFEIEERVIPGEARYDLSVENMQKTLLTAFHAYQKSEIIFPAGVNSFVPCFNRGKLLQQLSFLLKKCDKVLKQYTKLDDFAEWLLLDEYETLISLCEAMTDKWEEIEKVKEERVYFF